jgi:hypothetical protein
LSKVLTNQALIDLFPTKGIEINNVRSEQRVNLTGFNLAYLKIEHCEFPVGLSVSEAEIKHSFYINNSKIGSLYMTNLASAMVYLAKVEVNDITIYSLETKTGLALFDVKAASIAVRRSQIAGGIELFGNSRIQQLNLISDKVDGVLGIGNSSIGGEKPDLGSLIIFNSKINGPLIIKANWSDGGTFNITSSYAEKFYFPPAFPKNIQYGGFEFGSWIIEGTRSPKKVREFLDADIDFHPNVYTRVAASFRMEGLNELADEVTIAKRGREREKSSLLGRIASYISFATVGYGLRPEYGIGCFLILVFTGFLAFRSGERYVTAPYKPQSWLVFTLDTVIPLIHLDKRNDDVQFSGWRQYFLYFMRVSSAMLAYLVFKVLEKAFSPD